MSPLQISWIVVRQPHLALGIFPEQRLQRQIDRDRGRGLHQWRAALGATEDQQLRRPHLEPDLGRLAAVVHTREDSHAALLEQRLQPRHRLLYRMLARQMNQTITGIVHGFLPRKHLLDRCLFRTDFATLKNRLPESLKPASVTVTGPARKALD